MAHRKSIIKESIERLDTFRGIHESRRDAKRAIRETTGQSLWTISTGKIHSHTTRKVYQEQVLAFVNWARDTHSIKHLALLDEQADELVAQYLQFHIEEGKSPYTLQTERSALRLFFQERNLASSVALPRRTRIAITRSRGPAGHDRHFQPANWPSLLNFLRATGLRRREVKNLLVGDIIECDPNYDDRPTVKVVNGKGGKARTVPVLGGREQDVLTMKRGRSDDELVFPGIPKHLDVHSYRREFAQAMYLYHASGRLLPPSIGRLKPDDYDRDAAQLVSEALGHNRIDVVLRHYIR